MRILIALLTLSAGGAGFAYLQRTSLDAERTTLTKKDDESGLLAPSKADAAKGSVKELVNQIHEHTKSILDDFANQHGGHSDAPTDNAYQRLKQVTQSADASFRKDVTNAGRGAAPRSPHRTPPPKLDELQRMAFDPAATVEVSLDPAGESLSDLSQVGMDADKNDPASTIQAGRLEPIEKLAQPGSASSRRNAPSGTEISDKPASKRSAARMASNAPSKAAAGEWKIIGKTTERRPMHSMHLGTGGTRTLVIAGLDGQDRVAVRWLELMAESLARRPELLNGNEVLFFRAGNPDGLVRKSKDNARGVPLNRNFPSRRYRPAVGVPAFTVPASEVETRVILDTLYSFRPRRVIHLVSTSAKSQVLYNRLAKDLAAELERSAKVRCGPLDNEQVPGSLEDFADGTLEAAVLSLRLNVGTDWQQTWTGLEPRVLSAVIGRPVDSDQGEIAVDQDPDRTQLPLPLPNAEPISRRRLRRGYEELPPPPRH